MSTSSTPFALNGHQRSQNSSPLLTFTGPPSSNDGTAPSERASVTSHQHSPSPEQNGHYGVAGPSTGTVNGYTRYVWIPIVPGPPFRCLPAAVLASMLTLGAFSVVYAPSHNEQIIDHLYNAGFQMGVRTSVFLFMILLFITHVHGLGICGYAPGI